MNRRRMAAAVCALGLLLSVGCVSTFYDQTPVSGEKRLVVGCRDGFFGAQAKVWVEENGSFREVEVVGGD